MSGKGLLIMILGFLLIYMVMGFFWGQLSSRAVDNHVSYYKNTIAHNIAVSGANIGLRMVEETGTAEINNLPFSNGEIDHVWTTTIDTMSMTLTSVGTYMGVDKTVKVLLMKSTYAKYAWFIASVSTGSKNKRLWVTGDTVWGGFHSNQFLNIDGDPVFYGKVSLSGGINMTDGSHPQFLGGLVTGLEVNWDNNLKFITQKAAADEGVAQGGVCSFNSVNLWLTFNADGTVTYRTADRKWGDDSSKYSAPVTMPLSAMAPTGIIYLDQGDIYTSGVLKGQVTIVSDQSSGTGGGNVYFTDDLTYSVTPVLPDGNGGFLPNNESTDLLGIIATNNVNISSTVQSGGYVNNILNKDLRVDAGIFCRSGGFNLQGLGSTVSTPTGTIYINGSMTAGKEELVAIYNDSDQLVAGYNRHVVLDERFLVKPPLYFPYTGGYNLVSWLE